ncbi:sulfiredoxin, chloroplastic/mitochondrial isoform X1 [Eutrema salsugineum]|uniref:sulfiredoxin, chloroplastic/mitochondrial isoform X1 n=1 Tax=Eutrema salsugineum TaxID=72664 RepID=UPI000CECF987|nr:sulfiredoxin, chloroplastic/mitochondrial isoform X1 [Eutrema salsugineum]
MANLMMRLPSSLRSLSVSASSSNGSPPVIGGSSGGVGPMIVELPLEKIRRPLMRTRSNDQNKVKELMDSIREIGLQVPIDVIEVDGAYYGAFQNSVFFIILLLLSEKLRDDESSIVAGFSGCHRYEAHQKLGLPTIRCKIRKGTKETLRHHLR